jgi:hypothetical protein
VTEKISLVDKCKKISFRLRIEFAKNGKISKKSSKKIK